MKKISLVLLCLVATGIVACSEESEETTGIVLSSEITARSISSLYDSIARLEDTEDQLLIASTLTPKQKMDMWQIKLSNFEQNNSLTQQQTDFIEGLKLALQNESLFDERSPERASFPAGTYLENAKSLFGVEAGGYLLTRVENINHRLEKIAESGAIERGPVRSCTCESDGECYRITGVELWGVQWEYGTCPSGGCYVRTYFFGLWESSNTGRCKY